MAFAIEQSVVVNYHSARDIIEIKNQQQDATSINKCWSSSKTMNIHKI